MLSLPQVANISTAETGDICVLKQNFLRVHNKNCAFGILQVKGGLKMKLVYLSMLSCIGPLLIGCAAQNAKLEPGLRTETSYTRDAKSGLDANVYGAFQVSPECLTFGPPPSVKIVVPPRHGTAAVIQTKGHTSYPSTNPRFKCNSRLTPMTDVIYRSQAGFTGDDTLKVHTTFHEPLDNPPEDIDVKIKVKP
ncbi:hypothetical protein [Labrys neptuniae]